LLASTFLSCQKASERPVRAQLGSPNSKVTQQNLVPCSSKAAELIKSRQDLLIQMKSLTSAAEVRELTEQQKADLQKMVIDLAPISKAIAEEIKLIKSNKPQPTAGCYSADSANPDIKTPHTLQSISETDLEIAKKVAEITKKTNAIVQEDEQSQQIKAQTTLAEQQTYAVTAEFAEAMTESNRNGKMYISEGKIHKPTSAKEEMDKLIADKKASVCYLEVTSGDLKETDKITIKVIRAKIDETTKTAVAKIIFAGEEDKLNSLACFIKTDNEVMTEARKVFGDLIQVQ
jgi:hypothetical protein